MSKQDEATARDLLSQGLTIKQIARRMDVSEDEARELVSRAWRRDKEERGRGWSYGRA